MKSTRRKFIQQSATLSAAAMLGRVVGAGKAFSKDGPKTHPNILLIMVDQQFMPPAYAPGEGMAQGLKEILGFQPLSPDNPYTGFLPGYLRLRQNAVVFRTHYTCSSACVPSRACIMTGLYSTGVHETDGLLKTNEDVRWLDPNTPTLGHWFRAAGYSTHYFGKWHVSYPEVQGLPANSLESWGFANWESSCPEPHGGGAYNAGVYRDVGFGQDVVTFLRNKGQDSSGDPWFVVGSLVNPHDIGLFPLPWQQPGSQGVVPWTNYPLPLAIPYQGQQSNQQNVPHPNGPPLIVPLNQDGFPQDTYTLPATFAERLQDNNKPRCHYDYSLKFGLMAKAIQENDMSAMPGFYSVLPFQLQGNNASAWSLAYNQFYMYCLFQADMQIRQMLQALDEYPDLAKNTIVVFLSDHGEMAGAHGGMIQKWYNAYEETIHVPMVISSPLVNLNDSEMRDIHQPTSSIDLAPTLLALAGYTPAELRAKMEAIPDLLPVKRLVGADLSAHIKGEATGVIRGPGGKPRTGVFYMTQDTICDPGLHGDPDDYDSFISNVNAVIDEGYPLEPGTVTQPNHVHAFCTGDWKIVRYFDPSGAQPDEWELYCLVSDPIEEINLVDFRTGEVRDDAAVPGLNNKQLRLVNQRLRAELTQQEALMLGGSR